MTSAQATHPGLIRQNNEDCIRTDDSLGIYLLADGIGGHNAGEVASALAIDTVYKVLRSNIAHTAVEGYFELMVHAIQAAHWEINSKALTCTSLTSMGTTLVAAVLRENVAHIVHAGDSRCYLFQNDSNFSTSFNGDNNTLLRLTRDHTVGDQQLANGVLLEEIPKKQFHNLIQAVGCGDPPYPDYKTVELKTDDLLLICSDGLTDMLTDAEIEAILASGETNLDTLAVTLIDAANANGGRDNVSVVLIKVP
jgi:protein phosphatase